MQRRPLRYDNEEGMRLLEPEEVKRLKKPVFSAVSELAPVGWKLLVFVIAVVFLLKVAIRYEIARLPEVPDPVQAYGVAPDQVDAAVLDTPHFVTARARRLVNELTSFGIRLAGSPASEEMAVSWLLRELDNLRQQIKSDSKYRLTFSVDYSSGFFNLDFLSTFTSVYANISNVIARLDPIDGDTENALLINAHYDTQFDTVGASDDALSCAMMLEFMRAILSSPAVLKHSVIFLFNGAEENLLQASNAFIEGSSSAGDNTEGTGHPWAKHVRAFVNIDSCGTGGKEALFQTGPGPATSQLVRAYAEAAKYPFASVIGQEMFQMGLIPSDTDFRIFRDHGHIPGLDIAFYTNGYVYHSPYDTPDRIPNGSIERAGVNILSVIRTLASMDLANLPRVTDPKDRSGEKLVFFDIFSTYLVVYPFRTVGLLLNFLAVAGTIFRVRVLLFSDKHHRNGISYGKMLVAAVLAHVLALAGAVLISLTIATVMSRTSSCMSWYSRPWLVFPIYVLPSVGVTAIIHSCFFKAVMMPNCATANFVQKCETAYDVSIDAALIIMSMAIVILSYFSSASSFLFCLSVGFQLIAAALMDWLIPLAERSRHNSGVALVFRHCFLTLIPTIYALYIGDPLLDLFIPITGRIGGRVNPEYMIAIACLISILLLLIFHPPVTYLSGGHVSPFIKVICFVSGFVIITVLLTPLGHPYYVDVTQQYVHAQRSATQLTLQRTVRSPGSEQQASIRGGIWLVPLDYNSIYALNGTSTKLDNYLKKARLACSGETDPKEEPYCGLPFVYPLINFVHGKTFWIDIEPTEETLRNVYWPSINQMPTSPRLISAGRWLVQYRVDCGETPHCSLFIAPQSHAVLLGWHFGINAPAISNFPTDKLVTPPQPTDTPLEGSPRDTWFVLLRFGSSAEMTRLQQRSIIITLEVGASGRAAASGQNLLDFAIASHYFRGSSLRKEVRDIPADLADFVNYLPSWHFTVPVTSLYSNYIF